MIKWIKKSILSTIDWFYDQGKIGRWIMNSGLFLAVMMTIIMLLVWLGTSLFFEVAPLWIALIPMAVFLILYVLRILCILTVVIIGLAWAGIDILIDKIKERFNR